MTIQILFFNLAQDATGVATTEIPCVEPISQDALWCILVSRYPALERFHKDMRLAKNNRYAQVGEMIEPGDEIALIPPVSGG